MLGDDGYSIPPATHADPNTRLVERVRDALTVIAKVALLYSQDGGTEHEILDVDDYIQTVLIGESLIANRGFNHRDLVRRYRTKPGHLIGGREVAPSGISLRYKGQVKKLIDSRDIAFMAKDGITSGSAMKVACIAAFFDGDTGALIDATDRITRITHAGTDARLAALLTVLRYHQIFAQQEGSPAWLRAALVDAIARLEIGDAAFFLQTFDEGADLVSRELPSTNLLAELNVVVGLSHISTSVPIAACLWSFRPIDMDTVLNQWSLFDHHVIHTGALDIAHCDWDLRLHRRHFLDRGFTSYDSRMLGEDARSHFDLDTLFSIALSLEAAQRGVQGIVGDGELGELTDNLDVLALNLVELGVSRRRESIP